MFSNVLQAFEVPLFGSVKKRGSSPDHMLVKHLSERTQRITFPRNTLQPPTFPIHTTRTVYSIHISQTHPCNTHNACESFFIVSNLVLFTPQVPCGSDIYTELLGEWVSPYDNRQGLHHMTTDEGYII